MNLKTIYCYIYELKIHIQCIYKGVKLWGKGRDLPGGGYEGQGRFLKGGGVFE